MFCGNSEALTAYEPSCQWNKQRRRARIQHDTIRLRLFCSPGFDPLINPSDRCDRQAPAPQVGLPLSGADALS
jgi:hypothetical protein